MDYDSVNVSALTNAISQCDNSLGLAGIKNLESVVNSITWTESLAKENLLTGINNMITKAVKISNNLTEMNTIANMILKYQSYTEEINKLAASARSLKRSNWTTSHTNSDGSTTVTIHSDANQVNAQKRSINSQIISAESSQNALRKKLDSMIGISTSSKPSAVDNNYFEDNGYSYTIPAPANNNAAGGGGGGGAEDTSSSTSDTKPAPGTSTGGSAGAATGGTGKKNTGGSSGGSGKKNSGGSGKKNSGGSSKKKK